MALVDGLGQFVQRVVSPPPPPPPPPPKLDLPVPFAALPVADQANTLGALNHPSDELGTPPWDLPEAGLDAAPVAAMAGVVEGITTLAEVDGLEAVQHEGFFGQLQNTVQGLMAPDPQQQAYAHACVAAGLGAHLQQGLGDEAYGELAQSLLTTGEATLGDTSLKLSDKDLARIEAGKVDGKPENAAVQKAIMNLAASQRGDDEADTKGITPEEIPQLNQALGTDMRITMAMEDANPGDYMIVHKDDGSAHLMQVEQRALNRVTLVDGAENSLDLLAEATATGVVAQSLEGLSLVTGQDKAGLDVGESGMVEASSTPVYTPPPIRGGRR